MTARADDFEVLIEQHPLCEVFRLRVVTVLYEVVSTQLTHLPSEISHDQLDPLRRAGLVREECIRAAETLWEVEASVLESATEALEQQVRVRESVSLSPTGVSTLKQQRVAKLPDRVMMAIPGNGILGLQLTHANSHSPWPWFMNKVKVGHSAV